MATAADLRRIALSFEGAEEYPHFDRAAFKTRRTFVTLAPDGKTANLMYSPDMQVLKCTVHPEAFAPTEGGWGSMGITTVILAKVSLVELEAALRLAWEKASARPVRKARTWP